jgi:hypothetical protein
LCAEKFLLIFDGANGKAMKEWFVVEFVSEEGDGLAKEAMEFASKMG